MVLGNLVESASVDRLLACFHTLEPSLHSYPYICVLLLPVDYEEAASQKDRKEAMNTCSFVNT